MLRLKYKLNSKQNLHNSSTRAQQQQQQQLPQRIAFNMPPSIQPSIAQYSQVYELWVPPCSI